MKKITLSEYRQMNPYLAGKLIQRLILNREETAIKLNKQKKVKAREFSREDITKYMLNKILN